MSVRRKIFYGFTLAVLAVLLLLPATGWLARMQLFPFAQYKAFQSLTVLMNGTLQAQEDASRFVATRPNDFDLQFAHAMNCDSAESLRRLDVLDKKFPDNPVVLAARLKRMTAGQVHIHRAEEDMLRPLSQQSKDPEKSEKMSDAAAVAKFVAIAEQGERVAPTNAFFSCMVAAGNFARRQDEEAMTAWKRAGAKPDWYDYSLEEMNAKSKLLIERNSGSEVGFLPRAASSAAVLLPHFTVIRGSARMATVKSVETELAGNRDEGVALRGATRHIGAAMMTKSESGIGVLVGRTVTALAASRPGGAETIESPSYTQAEKDSNRPVKDREAKYVAYLQSIGHSEEATAFVAASRDGDSLKEIVKDGMSRTYMGFGDKTWRLMACWYADILLLAGVLFSLTFAGIFKLIYKFSPRLQKSEPLQASARWGVMLGLALSALSITVSLITTDGWGGNSLDIWGPFGYVRIFALLLSIFILVFPPIIGRFSAKSIGHGLIVMVGTLCTLAVVGAVGAATWHMFSGPIGAVTMIQGLSGGDPEGESSGTKNLWGILLPIIISVVMLSLPVVLLAVFAGFSRMLRIPVAAGVTRGMRAMAVPLACVMILGWGVCLVLTFRQESAAIAELKQFGKVGEPRMQAELLGRAYPTMEEGLRVP